MQKVRLYVLWLKYLHRLKYNRPGPHFEVKNQKRLTHDFGGYSIWENNVECPPFFFSSKYSSLWIHLQNKWHLDYYWVTVERVLVQRKLHYFEPAKKQAKKEKLPRRKSIGKGGKFGWILLIFAPNSFIFTP